MAILSLHLSPLRCAFTGNPPKHHLPSVPHGATITRTMATATAQASTTTTNRRSANYQPSSWSPELLESVANHHSVEIYKDRANDLENKVKFMIENEDWEPIRLLQLVDDIQRLGLGYRFQMTIKSALDKIKSLDGFNHDTTILKSLDATALYFRLLRQHGHEVSADVFNCFKGFNGDFKDSLRNDIKGLLSLYEASYLAFEGEEILDEAKAFGSKHLKNHKGITDLILAKQVSLALELPLHYRMTRLAAREYIQAYSGRKDANQLLLELAISDFNNVQSTLQRDLQDTSKWWKDIGLANKLSFARDRLMECFFWTVGMVFEPEFSNCRKGLTKVTSLITTIDDVYDVYGSLEELELFTRAVDRWDINAMQTLPEYMRLCFLTLYNTVNEMAYDASKEHGVNIIPYLTKAWADLCKAFLLEARWYFDKEIPTFEAYLDNAWRSSSGVVILTHAYFLMAKNVTTETLGSLDNYHDLLECSSTIFRLSNDLATYKAELERGESASSILCYMVQNGASEQDAREHISNLIDETWKKMNKHRIAANSPIEKLFIETAMNLARIAQCTYQYGDGHGAPDSKAKSRVLSVIIEPVVC